MVDFDGSDDSLRSTATSSIGFGSHTIFAVADGGSVSASQERGIFAEDQGDNSGYSTGIWFERSSYTGQQALYYSANYSKGSGTSSLSASGFTAKILILRKEKDVSVGWYINGSLSGTEATSGSVVTNATTTARPIRIGLTDRNYLGSMAQVWAVKTALSASIRKRFEHAAAYSFKISCN